ncbi:MAG: glycosyltransferase [Candidatus Bathyarchaeota archaeon]|nr:glycosyltransferase [Candidatus Bathyarchaeota archaeon]
MNIIILTSMHWNFLWQRPHQIAFRLANRGHNVLYFHSPISLNPSTFKRLRQEKSFFISRKLTEKLMVAHLFVPPFRGKLRFFTDKFASFLFMIYLKKFGFRPDVIFFYNPNDAFLLKASRSIGAKIIYDCVDDHSSFPGVPNRFAVVEAERKLIHESATILTVSKQLHARISEINPKCFYIPNGADYRHFNNAMRIHEKPLEIKNLKSPIIGFIGAVWDWVNIDLICKLAELHKDYSILLVGPVYYGLNDLKRYPNIFAIGTKKYELLPQYLSCMDVCLIPFKINDLTVASSPIKMYEYLAAGKPVVSTALPEVYSNVSADVVYIGENDEDFIKKVEAAVNEISEPEEKSTIVRRLNFAKNNSWEKRVDMIEKILKSIV